jgi:hypothetical protein
MPNGQTFARFGSFWPRYQRKEGDKVFIFSPEDSLEYVMYDFLGSIGDTVGFYVFVGDTFDVTMQGFTTENLFGQSRRIWQFWHIARKLSDMDSYRTIADSIGLIESSDWGWGTRRISGAIISGITYGTIVSVPRERASEPATFVLFQNYPNPFNSQTDIAFQLGTRSKVLLDIFDILGHRLRVLVSSTLEAGVYHVPFESESLSSGAYVYRLSVNGSSQSRTMILNK